MVIMVKSQKKKMVVKKPPPPVSQKSAVPKREKRSIQGSRFSIYDPRNSSPPPVTSSVSPALWNQGVINREINPAYEHRAEPGSTDVYDNPDGWPTVLICGICPDYNIVGAIFNPRKVIKDGSFDLEVVPMETTFFSDGWSVDLKPNQPVSGPVSGKTGRFSVSLKGRTRRLDQEGVVYVYMPDQRLGVDPFNWKTKGVLKASDYLDIVHSWSSHPTTKSYSGNQLSDVGMYLFSHPSDQVAYDQFSRWNSSSALTDSEKLEKFFTHFCVSSSTSHDFSARAMVPIIIVFSATSVRQHYEIRIKAEWYHRYAATVMQSTLHHPIPTASLAHINKERKELEEHNSNAGILGWFEKPVNAIGSTLKNTMGPLGKGAQQALGDVGHQLVYSGTNMALQRLLSRPPPLPVMVD